MGPSRSAGRPARGLSVALADILEVVKEVSGHDRKEFIAMHQPGLEPGSTAFKAVPLTD
jgi:hypothetical protein